jgi:DNA-binding NarL/FixJ family response regulator
MADAGAGQRDGSTDAEGLDPERVRVLVADDQQLIRDGIASLLAIQPGITIVGVAVNGNDAVAKAIALNPDVILMDVRMPELDGVAATARIAREAPSCRVVMLTTFDDEEYVVDALRAGAAGYLLKDLPASDLATAVRLAHAGVAQFGSAAAHRLTSALARPPAPAAAPARVVSEGRAGAGTDSLTAREIDVLRSIATGSTNREIAAQLFLSEGTVKNHISRILGRLGLRDRTQAAIYTRDHGII